MRRPILAIQVIAIFVALAFAGCAGVTSANGSNGGTKTVAPTIAAQPANQTVAVGQAATFSVTASGTAPFSYQWQKSSANILGATSASYTTPATTSADNGAMFDVIVSNSAGSQASTMAALTVNAVPLAPTITLQPANQTVTVGQTATFSVTATGTAPLSYQWQKNSANISGATASTYTTPATVSGDNGAKFDVVVSNTAGSQTSTMATLTVNAVTSSTIDVVTYHYDNLRTGQNLNETILTPANVNSTKFGKIGAFTVDGRIRRRTIAISSATTNTSRRWWRMARCTSARRIAL